VVQSGGIDMTSRRKGKARVVEAEEQITMTSEEAGRRFLASINAFGQDKQQ
jgi:hypothetical protein